MSTYAFRDESGHDIVLMASQFGMPRPAHTQTPGALAAVESVRAHGRAVRAQRVADSLVTDHGRPPVVPYAGDVRTAAARRLEASARARGWEVIVLVEPDRCIVEGMKREQRVGFRAVWINGKTAGCSWHEGPRDRYAMVDDPRPEGVNKKTRTGLAGKRPAGLGRVHLKLIASPRGIPCSITELNERI